MIIEQTCHPLLCDLWGPVKTQFENLIVRFFSEIRHQKRSLAALNEDFDNEVSGEKVRSKINKELLEVPFYLITGFY